jgi:hemoglobin
MPCPHRLSSCRTFVLALLPVALLGSSCATSGGPSTSPQPPPATSPAVATAPPATGKASLYDRLGGKPAISAVIDEFLKRVVADKRINTRFMNVDVAYLRGNLIDFVCLATGGPCQYGGRDMQGAHSGMQVVDEEFGALVEALAGALGALKVPKAEQDELLGALGPLKPQIVSPPPAAAAKHDPALARAAQEKAAALRKAGKPEAADMLEAAVTARTRGQRSYAEQLYSATERLLEPEGLPALEPLFREGAPERIKTALKTAPKDSAPQPKTAVGGSDEDEPDAKPKRGSLAGSVTIGGKVGEGTYALVMLTPKAGGYAKRKAKQRVIEQRERQFAPRFMAIPLGSTVSFPNFDPIFHNVFSLSAARRFDLGIYKNGETREVTFNKEGIIRLGCNLHSNMKASLVVVGAPHYVVADAAGKFRFRSLAPGKYTMKSWSDRSTDPVTQTIEIASGENTVALDLPVAAAGEMGTDKFGVPRGQTP